MPVEDTFKLFPTAHRAAIVDKKSESYVGFISPYNTDNEHQVTSLFMGLKKKLTEEEINEIKDEYLSFLYNDLSLQNIKDEIIINAGEIREIHNYIKIKDKKTSLSNLKADVPEDVLQGFKDMGYNIPKLTFPFRLEDNGKTIGIIGVSNLLWANRRANLQVFFDKNLDDIMVSSIAPYYINQYLKYLEDSNLYNISYSVSGSDESMLNVVDNSDFNLYASIPYASDYDGKTETSYLFQHYPDMEKENIVLPDNEIIEEPFIKEPLKDVIDLDNGYMAISTKAFEKYNVNINAFVKDHIKSMQNREHFTIPLGEDKYMIQEGNGNYGISKALQNYAYIIVDQNQNYSGFIGIVRENGRNAELEIGIKPGLQGQGLGTSMVTKFYDELIDKGYKSITAAVFDFNEPSKRLFQKVATFSGKRVGAYYINGKLWDMNYFFKKEENIQKAK